MFAPLYLSLSNSTAITLAYKPHSQPFDDLFLETSVFYTSCFTLSLPPTDI